MANDTIFTVPAIEPVTLAEAKAHLRVTHSDDDTYITTLIVLCREIVEAETRRSLITQTRKLRLPVFPLGKCIEIRRPPLQSVTSIQYYDTNNVLQTFSASYYEVDAYSAPGVVYLKQDVPWWPATYLRPNAVEITYVAGYGNDKTNVPSAIRQAILLLVSHYYGNREVLGLPQGGALLPRGFDNLVKLYRVYG